MEKEEKLQKLFAFAEELELTPDDIIKGLKSYYPINKNSLSKNVDRDIVQLCQKKKVGMFYYAEDESFSEELIPNKNVSGVVGYVDESGEHGLVVLLHQVQLPWSSDELYVFKTNKLNGKKNTRYILKTAKRLGQKAEAAEYCANYAYDSVNAGEAFLPSIDELEYLYKNKRLVNEKLALIDGADLLDGWFYWSSSEYSIYGAWLLYFGNGSVSNYDKDDYYYVRPVLAF